MLLNPRYGSDPIITLDGYPGAIAEPTIRQRRRLMAALAAFTDDQWDSPSRCDGWSNRDVVVHLESTNGFWAYSISSGLQGEPTRLLATFDPVASPAQLVADAGSISKDEVFDKFVASTDSLLELLASLDGDDWTALAEAPPGHISVSAVAHHALWDSWVHERDILVPLGIAPDEEADEVAASLRYVSALAPAIAVNRTVADHGVLGIAVTDPDLSFAVEIGERIVVRGDGVSGDARLTGDAVELLEELSLRKPFGRTIPPAWSWMIEGLAQGFDAERD